MHLVEILLPVADSEGQPFDAQKYVVEELSSSSARLQSHGSDRQFDSDPYHFDGRRRMADDFRHFVKQCWRRPPTWPGLSRVPIARYFGWRYFLAVPGAAISECLLANRSDGIT